MTYIVIRCGEDLRNVRLSVVETIATQNELTPTQLVEYMLESTSHTEVDITAALFDLLNFKAIIMNPEGILKIGPCSYPEL